MKKSFVIGMGLLYALSPAMSLAAECPPEVQAAKDKLKARTAVAAKPKSLAAARSQDEQRPRGQDAQAPRGQDEQRPRGQDAQAPRGQDEQRPRGQDTQLPRSQAQKARALIRQAEAACKQGKVDDAKSKASQALELMK